MRIGIITSWYDGGAGYVSKAYEAALLAAGHELFILAREGRYPRGDPFWDHPNVTWAAPHSSLTGVSSREFRRWAAKNRLEAVLFNEQRYWECVLTAREAGLLIGAYVDYYTADTVPLFRLYDFLVCNTRRHHSVFKDHPQACYIPWGTDLEMYRPQPRPDRPLTFFHSAGMSGPNDRKGTGLLLSAFRKVTGNARLIIHSQLPLSTSPSVWREAVEADSRIEFLVETVKPPGLYHRGDVYLYPSRLEGIGLSLPEAVASGLVAVTPDNPPMNEFVTPETGDLLPIRRYVARQDGYYWPEVDIDENSLVSVMQSYVDRPEVVFEKGAAARVFAEAHLNWQENSRELSPFLAQCRPLEPKEGPSDELIRRARKHDLDTNPTLVQRWWWVHKLALNYAKRRLSVS